MRTSGEKMTKKLSILAVLVCVVAISFWALRKNAATPAGSVMEALGELHDFNRDSLKGQYFILHFWAKWCEPCADEIPHLVNFAKNTGYSKPLTIVAVSLDPSIEDSKSILPDQGRDLPPRFILAHDPERHVAEKLGSFQYPESYLVGPDGQILEKWIGAQKWEKPQVLDYFMQRLK